MTNWMERAKAHFLQERQEHTDKTDETGVMSVSSVCSRPAYEKSKGVSSVSSAHSWHSYEKQCFSEEGGSVGFEATAPGTFEKNPAGDDTPPRPASDEDAEALGVFEGRTDVLVMRGVIDRQKADALVKMWCRHRDIAETRVTILEVSNDLTRCGRCIHVRQPGSRAYCGNGQRADLAPATGALSWLPPDLGMDCRFWVKRHE